MGWAERRGEKWVGGQVDAPPAMIIGRRREGQVGGRMDGRPLPPWWSTFLYLVDVHLDGVHGGVALLVVRGVDHDLVEDLVQPRHVADVALHHLLARRVQDPHGLVDRLRGANVGVRAKQDVLELGLLLVDLLDAAALALVAGGFTQGRHVGGGRGLGLAAPAAGLLRLCVCVCGGVWLLGGAGG